MSKKRLTWYGWVFPRGKKLPFEEKYLSPSECAKIMNDIMEGLR